ncbi:MULTISPECIES: cyclic lactone autoinducer peptide [Clostridium]|uniref:Cyclic lactone autoinducer peptide n=1 Tax=Clostridium senegalense TaxID=1465809 RepID=A0A6M0H053_9CLOT|nr:MULTISPECIES: cyclic lactone autoinducer peptide [Clostridium]MBU5228302.1 cyclic lactone autoinducer peptide [Clostridium senegalense]NEU04206.1 cyclic lactone autoinducer peptide [Clostridium senegalense]
MRKSRNKILMLVATAMTVVASTVASAACYWAFYQPEEPKSLRDE